MVNVYRLFSFQGAVGACRSEAVAAPVVVGGICAGNTHSLHCQSFKGLAGQCRLKRSPLFDCTCSIARIPYIVKKNFCGLSPSFRPQSGGTTAVVLLSFCLTALAVYHILGTLSTVFLKKSFCCFCNSVFPSVLDVQRVSSLPRWPVVL